MTSDSLTRGARVNQDITALLRSRHALLWIVSREEKRAENSLIEASAAAKLPVRFWDCAQGMTDELGKILDARLADPSGMLAFIRDSRERYVYVLRDLHKWLDPIVLRSMRNLARSLQGTPLTEQRAIVVLSPSGDVPPELAGHATVLEYPLPDRAEIAKLLEDAVSVLPEDKRANAAPNGTRDAAIDAAVGLSAEEAANCYSLSLVKTRGAIDPKLVASEKKRVIARERVLTWHDPDPRGLSAIGGLDLLKSWLMTRKSAFSPRARAYGLSAPRGMLLCGPPGTGKTLTAKCVSTAWGFPLLRLDMGALKSKYVGESEGNIRKALAVADTVSPCVLHVDEIEKAMAGATGPQGDGGVSADALGVILSWMQERTGSVFVIATANDVRSLPPELLRKGRFDEVFWVDLPTERERAEVLRATLAPVLANGQVGAPPVDVGQVARACAGFSGAEIAALVPDAMFTAFADGERCLTTGDLLAAAATVVPLSKTAGDKLQALREWAKGRARPASSPESVEAQRNRVLDI
jgi:hypothetical protein